MTGSHLAYLIALRLASVFRLLVPGSDGEECRQFLVFLLGSVIRLLAYGQPYICPSPGELTKSPSYYGITPTAWLF